MVEKNGEISINMLKIIKDMHKFGFSQVEKAGCYFLVSWCIGLRGQQKYFPMGS